MDKSYFLARSGLCAVTQSIGGSKEQHTLHFKAKTPTEIALFVGAEQRYPQSEEGDTMRERTRAAFIASSLCDEAGQLLFKPEEAQAIPSLMKAEVAYIIVQHCNRTDASLGKDSQPGVTSGLTTL